jgi:Fur family transcriptional regulator, ferric uptake regulator
MGCIWQSMVVRTTTQADTARRVQRDAAWDLVRERLHARGLRWTPQRRTLVEVLARTSGHVTGADLVERCRAVDPATTPSTVYRTLDVLEELGYLSHHHGVDGREEFHVLPIEAHGHLHCRSCGGSWEIGADEADAIAALFDAQRSFAVDRSHVTITGRCATCASSAGDADLD